MKGKEAAEVEDDRSAHKRGSTSTCRFLVDLARPRAVPAQPVAQTLTKLFHRAWGATSAAHRGQEPPRRRARRQCRAGAAPAAGGPHRTGRRGLSRAWKAWNPRSIKNIDARAVVGGPRATFLIVGGHCSCVDGQLCGHGGIFRLFRLVIAPSRKTSLQETRREARADLRRDTFPRAAGATYCRAGAPGTPWWVGVEPPGEQSEHRPPGPPPGTTGRLSVGRLQQVFSWCSKAKTPADGD